MGFPRILEWVAISFSRGSSRPGTEPQSLHLQVDSLPLNHRVNMKATKDDQFINAAPAAAAAKSLQSCPTPCDPRDGSPPGSPVPGISHWSGLPFPSPVHESVK